MTRLRQTIAKDLRKHENAAMLTTFNEVDMSGIISMRRTIRMIFREIGVKLGSCLFVWLVWWSNYPSINAERVKKLFIKIITI